MDPQYSEKDPFRKIALMPLLGGLTLLALGVLMIIYPLAFVQVFVVLFGVGVLIMGINLVLFGMNLLRRPPRFQDYVRVNEWRIWRGDDEL